MPADITATLDDIRERHAKTMSGFSSNPGLYVASANDVPRLLAALDAVLAFADDRDRMAAGLASGAAERIHPALAPFNARARHDREIAAALRNAISRALLGEDCSQ